MSLLTLPFEIPARIVRRTAEDLAAIARVAREVPARLDALDARTATVQKQLDRALTLGESIERHGAAVVELGARIDARGQEIVAIGERMLELGDAAMERSVLVADRAREVAERGADVAAALPTLQRAVSIAEPLEGAVERLGRAIDRLPGGRARAGQPGPTEASDRNVTSSDEP